MTKPNDSAAKKWPGTKLMYISGTIAGILGLASLINHIWLFKNSLSQYVAQGYPSADVAKYLIPTQLLPGVFESLAVYGGIAILLFAAGIINQNIARCYGQESKEIDNVTDAVIRDENASDFTEADDESVKAYADIDPEE